MDYSKKSRWAYYTPKRKQNKAVDVFFAYPTVYFHKDKGKNHNMSLNNVFYKTLATLCTAWQTEVFKEDCNIFAPYYRQVGIESLKMTDAEFVHYAKIAYIDLRDAFLYYMEHINNGRPYILAGHSQGSALLQELMRREFSNKEYTKNLVAGYLIGFSILKDDFIFYPHLKFAKCADDLGVIISYNTVIKGAKKLRVVRKGGMCINPLNWTLTDEYAPKHLNSHTSYINIFNIFKIERFNYTGAYTDRENGTLVIDDDTARLIENSSKHGIKKLILKHASLHMFDYALFYGNLKANVKLRIAKFMQKREGHN